MEPYEAIKYWKGQGVKTRVAGVTNRAGSLGSYEKVSPGAGCYDGSGQGRVWRRLMNRARRVVGCHMPFYEMSILFNGDVLICSEVWNRATVLGNVATQSLKEIWNSERANKIRRLLLKKKFDKLDSCRGCSLAR